MKKGWLDNYNDSKASAPEGFQGDGYSTVGRNYSPAWGGQFQMGGNVYPVDYVPQAQVGKKVKNTKKSLEQQVDTFLGNPQEGARYMSDINPDEDPVDNIRHTFAGRYTQDAISKRLGNGVVGNVAGLVGSNLMGAAHELSTIVKDDRPWPVKLRESGEDMFNNAVGSVIGALPYIDDKRKDKMIYDMSFGNLLPDGYVQTKKGTSDNVYFKDKQGHVKRKYQMGGSLPGATGMMYSRNGAPSNGPYAKKTMASAQEGVQVTPKSIKIPASENPDPTHVHQIRRTKSLKDLGKRSLPVEQAATNEFVDWYTNPETLKRFESNTGIPGNRLQDFVGKALRTPMRPAKEDDVLSVDDNAQYRDAFWQDQNYRDLNKSTGEILYHDNLGATTKNVLSHELSHASNIDELLGPKLKSILGNAEHVFSNEKAYLNRPTETYGNFHEFRKNLGLKPGQKIDKPTLQKLVKKKNLGNERFYRAYDSDKITKAINTIALNDDSQNDYIAKDGKVIKDNNGYWNPENWGKVVEIDSNNITMQGVNQPLLGISDEGDTKLMKPGKNYKFKGKKVTEYPMAKNGIRQEQKGLQNLDNLVNFTNYNTKQPGGWLEQYN